MKISKTQALLLDWTRAAYRHMWDALILRDDVLLKASGVSEQTAFRWVGEVDGIRTALEYGRFDSAALKRLARMVDYNLHGFVCTAAQQQRRRSEQDAAWKASRAAAAKGGDDGNEA